MDDLRAIEESVLEFLRKHYLVKLGLETLEKEDPLFERGILDSLGMLELLSFLENNFSVTFEPEDMTWENLSTVAQVAHTVQRRRRVGGTKP
jgi:acyl carrier protein